MLVLYYCVIIIIIIIIIIIDDCYWHYCYYYDYDYDCAAASAVPRGTSPADDQISRETNNDNSFYNINSDNIVIIL